MQGFFFDSLLGASRCSEILLDCAKGMMPWSGSWPAVPVMRVLLGVTRIVISERSIDLQPFRIPSPNAQTLLHKFSKTVLQACKYVCKQSHSLKIGIPNYHTLDRMAA